MREPKIDKGASRVLVHLGPSVPPPALPIIEPRDGCRWPERCRRDGLCWVAEKRVIAAERAAK